MNVEIELLKLLPRFFNALDTLIEDYGIYLYLVFVWLAMAVIAWIISGGLRKRLKENAAVVIPCIIVMTPPPRQSTPPTIDIEVEQMGAMLMKPRTKTMTNAPQIHASNCTAKLRSYVHETGRIMCNSRQGAAQERIVEILFWTEQALPLSKTKVLRLAKISPIAARSPARQPRDGRETSGKKSDVMSRACSRTGRTAATAMPPSDCPDDSQDSLPCTRGERAMAASETCGTTRLKSQP